MDKKLVLELQNHNSEDLQEREKQHQYNKFLMDLSKDTGIECIVQNIIQKDIGKEEEEK